MRHLRKLYEVERERALLIDGVTDYAIFMLDLSGHVASWNAGAERLKGYRADEIIGQHFSRFYPEEDVARGKPAKELETAAREGRIEDEGWRVRKDGSLFSANVIITALRDENGRLRAFAKVTRDLTERKRADEALRTSQEQFATAFEHAPIGMALVAPDGRFIRVNQALSDLLGYSSEDLTRKSFQEITHPEDLEPDLANVRRVLAGEISSYHMEKRYFHKSGRVVWVILSVSLVRDKEGQPVHFISQIQDITERKQAETRIRYLNRVYAVLSDVNQAIVRVREPQALFAEACRIAVEKGGFRMAWVGLLEAGANCIRLAAHAGVTDGYLDKLPSLPGDTSGKLGPVASALREGGHAVCNDIEHDPGAAAWRTDALARGYRAATAFPLTAKGKTLGTFTLYASEPEFFDDEELRLLDEMAMDLAFAMEMGRLEEGRLLLGTAVEQVPVSVVITDTEGRIEYVNPAFTQITGYTAAEALGKNPRLLKSGKHDRTFYENLWNTIAAGKVWQGEIVNRRKDGSLYMEEGTITPVRSEGGQVIRFVSIMQDVTERNRMEEELRHSEERFRLLVEHIHDALITGCSTCRVTRTSW